MDVNILELGPSKKQLKKQKREENSNKKIKNVIKSKKERSQKIEKAKKTKDEQIIQLEEKVQKKFETQFSEYEDILNKKKFRAQNEEQEFDLDLKEPDSKPLNKKEQYDIIDDILKQESNRNIEKLEKLPKPTIMTNFFKHLEKQKISTSNPVKTGKRKSKFLSFYCDYVGYDKFGIYDSLARITIVNEFGDLIYQKEIQQTEKVTDYRNTGLKNLNSMNGISKEDAFEEIQKLIGNSKLIGFENKLEQFQMTDISKLSKKSFQEMAKLYLGIDIKLSTTAVEKANIIFKIHQLNSKK
eukprot:gene2140-2006_t